MDKSLNLIKVERLTNFAIFISISIVLAVFEMVIPLNFIMPGLKLGLGNLLLVMLIDKYTFAELFVFQLLKISITTFILGLFSVYLFSLSGGLCALVVMYLLKRTFKQKISVYTLSMCGAIAHNCGQIVFAIFALHSPELISYIPFLVLFGSLTGFLLALLIEQIEPYINGGFNVRS